MKNPDTNIFLRTTPGNTRLYNRGLRATRTRLAIFDLFQKKYEPLSAEEIHEILTEQNIRIDAATIYRVLKALEATDLITQIDPSLSGKRVGTRKRTFYYLKPMPQTSHL